MTYLKILRISNDDKRRKSIARKGKENIRNILIPI